MNTEPLEDHIDNHEMDDLQLFLVDEEEEHTEEEAEGLHVVLQYTVEV